MLLLDDKRLLLNHELDPYLLDNIKKMVEMLHANEILPPIKLN